MEHNLTMSDRVITVSRIVDIEYTELFGGYQSAETGHPFCELLYTDYGRVTVTGECYQGALLVKQLIVYRPHEKHRLCCLPNEPATVVAIRLECDGALLDAFAEPTEPEAANHYYFNKGMLAEKVLN